MNLIEIVKRIRAKCTTFERRVGATAEFEDVANETADVQMPFAFVLPLADTANPREHPGDLYQEGTEFFGVAVCIDNTSSTGKGGISVSTVQQLTDLHNLRQELWNALLAWTPEGARNPVFYVQGVPMLMNNKRLFHQFQFGVPVLAYSEGITGEEGDCSGPPEMSELVSLNMLGPLGATLLQGQHVEGITPVVLSEQQLGYYPPDLPPTFHGQVVVQPKPRRRRRP